jgi:iron-only hydrogenase group A
MIPKMIFNIEVNNRVIQARKGDTILETLRQNGIKVPTLCNQRDLSPTGACRMCVVEVEGKENLVPSCSFAVEEWMKITTHSPRVLKARKTIVELLLSNHPDDCLYCERNGNCELQSLAEDLNIRERRITGKKTKYKIDKSSPGITRDPSKCILCGRCVRVCGEFQHVSTLYFAHRGSSLQVATTMHRPLNFSNCIHCGQCVIACPTGALTEKVQFTDLDQTLADHQKKVIVQYSPTSAVAIAEEFGIKAGKDYSGIINAALRKIGFDVVFETSFAADVLMVEQAEEFIRRFESGENLPLITGCCPSWVKFAQQEYPDFLPFITSVKSPQQIMGGLIKSFVSQELTIDPGNMHSVSVMPCTAKKFEAQRVEMMQKGIADIDTVLTTRELARLIRLHGVDMEHLSPEPSDEPFETQSSAGKIVGVSGGPLEALLRTIYYKYTGKELPNLRLTKLRSSRAVKETELRIGKKEITVAAVSGIANAARVLDDIRNGKRKYHILEIMACPGGCINGGGQPISSDDAVLRNRTRVVYEADNREVFKTAHRNPAVAKLYDQFFESPGSGACKKICYIEALKPESF